jgi:hypothetical protein
MENCERAERGPASITEHATVIDWPSPNTPFRNARVLSALWLSTFCLSRICGERRRTMVMTGGCDVILLRDGSPPSTATSTGFLTFAAHEGFDRGQLFEAMSQVTGKGLCDSRLLTHLLDEASKVVADVIAAYGIPVDKVERVLRVRRAADKTGQLIRADAISSLDWNPSKPSTMASRT